MQAQCLTNSAGVPLSPNTCVVTCPPAGTPAGAVLTANGAGGFTWGTGGGTTGGTAPAFVSGSTTATTSEAQTFSGATFTVSNATAVTVLNGYPFNAGILNNVITWGDGVAPATQGTYTAILQITGPGGSYQQSVTMTVLPVDAGGP